MTEFSNPLSIASPRRRLTVGVGVLAAVLGTGAWFGRASGYEAPAPVTVAAAPVQVSPRAGLNGDSYAELLAQVSPAVVTVRSQQMVQRTQLPFDEDALGRLFGERGQRPPSRRASGLGSGVVVTDDGYVLTNEHVVSGAQKVSVELADGRTFDAKVVGTDAPSDLAVLKVAATGLKTLPIGDSEAARVGDVVFAVGNPLGIGQSVTMGIVSAKGRASGGGDGAFEDFIQTDAPINQGNSGGALVNTRGELIGINSQIISPVGYNIGIGFAVPVNMAKNVMDQLVKTGAVRRGMLGVTVQNVTADMAKSLSLPQTTGAIVSEVQSEGPGGKAGLQPGDVILALDGKPVDSSNSLRNHVAPLGPEAKVTLTILRDGNKRDVAVTLAELPTDRGPAGRRARGDGASDATSGHGLAVQPLTPELARRLGAPPDASGVVVAEIDPDGAAAEAGLKEGDIIARADGETIERASDLKSALAKATADKPSLLMVVRDGRRLFLTLAG